MIYCPPQRYTNITISIDLMDQIQQNNIPAYDYEGNDSWIQRRYRLEPKLIEYFVAELKKELDPETGQLRVEEIDGRKIIFGNGTRTALITDVVNCWRSQGCQITNLDAMITWVYRDAEEIVLAEFQTEA